MAAGKLLGTAALVLAVGLPVHASVNGGGSIIVHTNDAYTHFSTSVCTTTLGQPASCEDAITRTDKASGTIVWFLAAFVPEATPNVAAVYFGMRFNDATLDPGVRYGHCSVGSGLAIEDAGWPSDVAAGVTLGFVPAMTDHLFRFYYFQVEDSQSGPDPWLCSAVNPAGHYAAFFDNHLPPNEDRITRFGCVHWYDDEGFNTCPVPPPALVA